MNPTTYTIKTANYEGPFNLLLNLVEERKLFINDISLAAVTEDYLKYVNSLSSLSPVEASSFLIVAATLILVKSKSLLPNLSLTDEEQSDIKSLEERLRLYELFNRLSLNIKNNFGEQVIFAPLERKRNILIFLPDNQITRDSMMTFARETLGNMPVKTILPEVEVRKVISIEEMILKLTDRIQTTLKTSFKNFAGGFATREEKIFVIVGFLAMLELVRNGILEAVHESDDGDIMIQKLEISQSNE